MLLAPVTERFEGGVEALAERREVTVLGLGAMDSGTDTTVPEVTPVLPATEVAAGHGRDTFARVIERLRAPST